MRLLISPLMPVPPFLWTVTFLVENHHYLDKYDDDNSCLEGNRVHKIYIILTVHRKML